MTRLVDDDGRALPARIGGRIKGEVSHRSVAPMGIPGTRTGQIGGKPWLRAAPRAPTLDPVPVSIVDDKQEHRDNLVEVEVLTKSGPMVQLIGAVEAAERRARGVASA